MNILITMPHSKERDIFFPENLINSLKMMGSVRLNERNECYTQEEISNIIKDIDVCITHWDSPVFSAEVLKNACRLGLIAHAAGSVANIVTEQVYESGIKVCSANKIMARYVAEGVLTYILCGLRNITKHSTEMKNGLWLRRITEGRTLFHAQGRLSWSGDGRKGSFGIVEAVYG